MSGIFSKASMHPKEVVVEEATAAGLFMRLFLLLHFLYQSYLVYFSSCNRCKGMDKLQNAIDTIWSSRFILSFFTTKRRYSESTY